MVYESPPKSVEFSYRNIIAFSQHLESTVLQVAIAISSALREILFSMGSVRDFLVPGEAPPGEQCGVSLSTPSASSMAPWRPEPVLVRRFNNTTPGMAGVISPHARMLFRFLLRDFFSFVFRLPGSFSCDCRVFPLCRR